MSDIVKIDSGSQSLEEIAAAAAKYGKANIREQLSAENILPYYTIESKEVDGRVPGIIKNARGVQFDKGVCFVPALVLKSREYSEWDNAGNCYDVHCKSFPSKERGKDGEYVLRPEAGMNMQSPSDGTCVTCDQTEWKTINGKNEKPNCGELIHLIGYHIVGLDPDDPDTLEKVKLGNIMSFQFNFKRSNLKPVNTMLTKLMHYSTLNEFEVSIQDQKIKFDGMFRTVIRARGVKVANYYNYQFDFIDSIKIDEKFAFKLTMGVKKLEDKFFERVAQEKANEESAADESDLIDSGK